MNTETKGLALVICAFDQHINLPDNMLPGMVVPLVWSQQKAQKTLPEKLLKLAEQVKQTVQTLLPNHNLDKWTLQWLPALESVPLTIEDFEDLVDDWSSGYLSLVGALYMAVLDVPSRPFEVFASACQGKALAPVRLVEAKRQTIRRWLGNDVPFTLHVPVGSEHTDGEEIQLLSQGVTEKELHQIITPYLSRLGCKPTENSSLEMRCDYANLPFMRKARHERLNYHREYLVDLLAEQLHKGLSSNLQRPSVLYLCQGKGYGVVHLLIKAFAPTKAIVFYSNETHDHAKKTKEACQSQTTTVEIRPWPDTRLRVPQPTSSERVVVDITSGTAAMSSLLTMAANQYNMPITYLEHGYDESGIIYGKERLRTLKLEQ